MYWCIFNMQLRAPLDNVIRTPVICSYLLNAIASNLRTNQQLSNQQLTNQQLANQQLTNQQLANQQLTNQQLINQQLANQQLTNQQLTNQQLANQQLAKQQLHTCIAKLQLQASSCTWLKLALTIIAVIAVFCSFCRFLRVFAVFCSFWWIELQNRQLSIFLYAYLILCWRLQFLLSFPFS